MGESDHGESRSTGSARWDRALTRRLRVLLHTRPLLELKANDARRDPELRHYDSLVLALAIFDLVVDRAGLEEEIDGSSAVGALRPLLAALDAESGIEPDETRHAAMVERLIGALRNEAEARRPFAETYADFEEGSVGAVKRLLEFRLLYDHHHPSGRTVLRLSNEAVNLFLSALELDIEDAQAAAEAIVHSQLARGRFDEAAESARNARWQSLRYAEKIDRVLRDTRRDVSIVDWHEEVPRLLAEALAHIAARLDVERGILATARNRLDELPPSDEAADALRRVERLIEDCRLRHVELHERLIGARGVFLDAQARQSFSPEPSLHRPDLIKDVLEPTLALDRRLAGEVVEATMPVLVGAHAPEMLSLTGLVGWLLRPRRQPALRDVPVTEIDPTRLTLDLSRFDEATRARIEQMLAGIDAPVSLSALLDRLAAEHAPRAALEMLVLSALVAFAPDGEAGVAVRASKRARALSHHGFAGDDLDLAPRESST